LSITQEEFNEEMMSYFDSEDQERMIKELERKQQIEELKFQIEQIKEEYYETHIKREEQELLRRFDHMLRGRYLSEATAMRLVEMIRSRIEPMYLEQRVRALEAERYMFELNKIKFIKHRNGEITKKDEFIEKDEMEVE
jgi:hypothetical protein